MSSWLRVALPLAVTAAVAVPAYSQADDSAVARFNECAAIRNDTARLSCFDHVTRDVRASASSGASTSGRRVAAEERTRNERENFGFNVRQQEVRHPREMPKALTSMVVKVAASKRHEPGYWSILLEDGAIWESTEISPQFVGPQRGETVKIRRGMMGGFLLDVGHQPSVRVRRVS